VKVLVTGANGFVGRSVMARLMAQGDTVVAAYGPGAERATPDGVLCQPLDVTNDASVRGCLTSPVDAVIHLAAVALSKSANQDPARAWAVNAEGTARLAAALSTAAAGWESQPVFLLASTGEVYAPSTRPSTETDPVQPGQAYGASKLGAELAAQQTWRCHSLKVIVARAFPHSGAGQDPSFWIPGRCKMLRDVKRNAWPVVPVGDLSAVRDFLHVDDVAEAYALLLKRGAPGEVYNVASGSEVTLDEMHTRLERLLGISPKREVDSSQVRKEARPYLVGDATKLRAATGWKPRRSLDDMLRDVLNDQTN
jgi:GDP-4-dehydro-6-deoxy-D-mannose reductase